jgi:hypothetical protein
MTRRDEEDASGGHVVAGISSCAAEGVGLIGNALRERGFIIARWIWRAASPSRGIYAASAA